MAGIRWGLTLLLLVCGVVAPAAALNYPDQGQAYAQCQADLAAAVAHPQVQGPFGPGCAGPFGTTSPYYTCKVLSNTGSDWGCQDYAAGVNGGSNFYNYPAAATCTARPDEYGWSPPSGTAGSEPVCYNGCKYTQVADPSGGFYAPNGDVCTVADTPPPVIDTDGDGVPDEDDAFPNDPNESADSDGDGIGDNADFSPNDPTDGSDEPGEEDGDDEGDNTASGGGDCKAPPSCKGDGIQCNQLFQQWQIRCSGATVTGDPTNCSSGYSCSGDSVQCATVALLRKTACAADGNGDDGTGGTPGDANGNGVADVLEGSGAGDTGDPGEDDDVTRFGIGVDASLLDQENIFGGGSCPTPPSLTIMGKTISGSDFPYWCQAMAILRALILIFGAFTAVKILTGWGFS